MVRRGGAPRLAGSVAAGGGAGLSPGGRGAPCLAKACLYIKRLADLDPAALQQLIAESVTEVRRRHGTSGDSAR